MDFESLKNKVSGLTMYDLKAGVRSVQNAVMNLTEMESKVREATNADPWGASATLMQEISQGTHNYQQLNEIMPLIYKRFTDKTAEEWRQIYKALQLLEFLVKNGSERVVDDARSHLSLLRMLRQFHFIDQNGKDQGINVRNRSAELVKLLSDVDTIRQERKKARANKNKYGGVEGGSSFGAGMSSGNRYGGFGSESAGYGGYSGEVYGDGGGFGGQETDFSGTQRRADGFEEYDAEEEGATVVKRANTSTSSTKTAPATTTAKTKVEPPKPKQPAKDLFDLDDEPIIASAAKPPTMNALGGLGSFQSNAAAGDDDDFDDFQSAPGPVSGKSAAPISSIPAQYSTISPPPTISSTSSTTQFAAPRPVAGGQAASFNNLFATPSPGPQTVITPATSTVTSPPAQIKPQQPLGSGYRSSGPNYFTPVNSAINSNTTGSSAFSQKTNPLSPNQTSYSSSTSMASLGKPAPKSAAAGGADAFGSLWNTASSKAGVQAKATNSTKGPDLASMAKARSEANIWGAPAGSANATTAKPPMISPSPNPSMSGQSKPKTPMGNGLDDLLG